MSRSAILPGEILKAELKELGVTPTDFARQIAVPALRVSEIIRGKRAITGDTALRLGHWFKTSGEFWLNLQNSYNLRIAKKKSGDSIARLPTKSDRLKEGVLK